MISLIPVAHAASDAQIQAQCFVDKINIAILFPLITLLMSLAFLFFLWGAFTYVKNADNETAREQGRNHLLYGIIGMLVMVSAFAILNVAAGTFGINEVSKKYDCAELSDSQNDNVSGTPSGSSGFGSPKGASAPRTPSNSTPGTGSTGTTLPAPMPQGTSPGSPQLPSPADSDTTPNSSEKSRIEMTYVCPWYLKFPSGCNDTTGYNREPSLQKCTEQGGRLVNDENDRKKGWCVFY